MKRLYNYVKGSGVTGILPPPFLLLGMNLREIVCNTRDHQHY